jgi:peroxin-13
MPASSKELTPANFAAFAGGADGAGAAPRPSKKPFIMFMLAVFGLPYLMGKLIKALARSQEAEQKRLMAENPQAYGSEPLDPNKLEFCRLLYDFTPDTNMNSVQGLDLAVKKGDMVAVLSKTDPLGNPSEWWRCRARDGRMGYLPGVYLEIIQRRQPAQITSGSQAGSLPGSRAQTMTNSSAATSRAATMTGTKGVDVPPKVEGKMGDIGVDSFQKGAFYS